MDIAKVIANGNIALVYDRSIRGHGIIGSDGKYVANPQFKEFLDEYYETRPSWDLGLGSGLFSIETDYLEVDAIVKTIKENITPSGIYNVNPNKLIISDLINAKNMIVLFLIRAVVQKAIT